MLTSHAEASAPTREHEPHQRDSRSVEGARLLVVEQCAGQGRDGCSYV